MIPAADEGQLTRALGDCFEGMVFQQIMDHGACGTTPRLDGTELASCFDMHAPLKIRLVMVMTREHARDCYQAVMVNLPEKNIPEKTLVDLTGEILNTAAGRLREILVPDHADPILGLPERVSNDRLSLMLAPRSTRHVIWLNIESHRVFCMVECL